MPVFSAGVERRQETAAGATPPQGDPLRGLPRPKRREEKFQVLPPPPRLGEGAGGVGLLVSSSPSRGGGPGGGVEQFWEKTAAGPGQVPICLIWQGLRIVASFSCGTVLRADEGVTANGVRLGCDAMQTRDGKERSMRKGIFASVAALTAGAGVALAQVGPGGPPPGAVPVPGWAAPPNGPVPNAPPGGPASGYPDPQGFYGVPGGYPAVPGVPSAAGSPVPPAGEMPLYGEVPGPNSEHPMNPTCVPPTTHYPGQVHKAAGGPDRWWFNVEENVWTIRSMPVTTPLLTIGPVAGGGLFGADGTFVALGDQNLERHLYLSALRVSGGWWDKCRKWGVELGGFITEDKPQV